MKFDSNRVSLYLILVFFLLMCSYIIKRASDTYVNVYNNYPVSMPSPIPNTNNISVTNYRNKNVNGNCCKSCHGNCNCIKEGMCGCEKNN